MLLARYRSNAGGLVVLVSTSRPTTSSSSDSSRTKKKRKQGVWLIRAGGYYLPACLPACRRPRGLGKRNDTSRGRRKKTAHRPSFALGCCCYCCCCCCCCCCRCRCRCYVLELHSPSPTGASIHQSPLHQTSPSPTDNFNTIVDNLPTAISGIDRLPPDHWPLLCCRPPPDSHRPPITLSPGGPICTSLPRASSLRPLARAESSGRPTDRAGSSSSLELSAGRRRRNREILSGRARAEERRNGGERQREKK